MRSQLSARKPPSSTSNSRRSSSSAPNKSTSKPKKNKYANFSKADDLSMDPLDAMINESRTKLRELHREEDSKTSRRRQGRKRSSSGELTSLEAVDHLLSTVDGIIEEVEAESVEEKRDRQV